MNQDGSVIRNSFSFSNDKNGFDLFLVAFDSLDPSYEKRIVFESTGHYGLNLKCFLEEHNLSFMEINSVLIKWFSSSATFGKTKTDKADIALIAFCLTSAENVTYPTQSYHIRNLKSLTRSRDTLVRMRSRQLALITNVMDKIFPEFKSFFNSSFKSATAMYLLKNYSIPSKMAFMNSESYRKMSSKLRKTISYAQFSKLRGLAKDAVGREDSCLTCELRTYLDIYQSLGSKINAM